MKTRTRGASFPTLTSLVRREDDARRASMRAEARLSYDHSQAGGIEGAKRYSLSKHRREKEQVRQELDNIKNSYKRSNAMMMQNPGNMKLANPQFAEELEEQEYLNSLYGTAKENNKTKEKKYGRNYFGYKSEPGSNRPQFEHIKAIKEKYSPVKNYYEYKGPKVMDKRTREKLMQQQKQNMTVQERVKLFGMKEKKKSDPLKGYRILPATAPETREVVKEEKGEEKPKQKDSLQINGNNFSLPRVEDESGKKGEIRDSASPRNAEVGLARRHKSPEPVKSPGDSDKEKENTNILPALPDLKEEAGEAKEPVKQLVKRTSRLRSTSPTLSVENMSVIGSLASHPAYKGMKPKTALDLVFDADKYAPDGRLRTVHCMPDVNQAFKEARQARYVRTKYRRDLETELTVNEIFDR